MLLLQILYNNAVMKVVFIWVERVSLVHWTWILQVCITAASFHVKLVVKPQATHDVEYYNSIFISGSSL